MSVRQWRTIVPKLGTTALLGAAVVFGVLWWRTDRDRDAAHDARVAAEATAQRLGRIADSLARVRIATTDTFTVERERWRTLIQTDTLIRVRPETLIVRAEAAIAACDRALNACVAEVGVLREAGDSLRSALKLQRRELSGCKAFVFLPCIQPSLALEAGTRLPDLRQFRAAVDAEVAVGRVAVFARGEVDSLVRGWVGGRWYILGGR